MSDISRELRKVADELLIGVANTRVSDLADRIDAEMVEWPLGADKKPIKPCQTVYLSPLGNTADGFVRGVSFDTDGPTVCVEREGALMAMMPEWLTHERQDSFERIADELDNLRLTASTYRHLEACDEDAIHDFAERIRRLAEREEER